MLIEKSIDDMLGIRTRGHRISYGRKRFIIFSQLDLASTTDKWKELQSIVGDGVVSFMTSLEQRFS